MKSILRYFAAHPTAANILMISIVLLGMATLPSLNKETFPQLKADMVSVNVPYPGASPAEVAEGICNRLEDATDGISFLDEQSCSAQDNLAAFVLTMQEAGEIKQFKDDVQSAVDGITDFPQGTEQVTVQELGRVDHVLSVAIVSQLGLSELKKLAEHYRSQLLTIPNVPIVEVTGFSQHEFRVLVSPESLQQYKLSIQDIANLVGAQSLDRPAGVLESDERSYQVRFENARRSPSELADLVILNTDKGGQLRLGDIAEVEDRFADQQTYTELNGQPAALLQISKNKTDDSLTVFNAVKAYIDEQNRLLPDGTQLYITQDSASVVQERLDLILTNGWQGLLLASLALFLFFTWRYTFWVAVGLPISFLGGLVAMNAFGVTINMISMVALLMAIGILMDDAIVLSESIESEHRNGKSPLDAAVDGTSKVARGVMASFTTSVLLFGSLLFLKGEMGQIMSVLPVVLLSVLVISLIEAFLVLPNHLKHALSHAKKTKPSKWRTQFDALFERLRDAVGVAAHFAVKARYFVLGGAIALFVVSIGLLSSGNLKFKGFPSIEGNILEARILMPQGTPFSRTQEVVDTLQQALQEGLQTLPAEQDAELIKTNQVSYSRNADANEQGPHLATITLDLLDAQIRHSSLLELQRAWREHTPLIADAVSIQFKEPVYGPGGQAISIRLQGGDLQQLSEVSWKLQNWLKAYTGVSNIMDDLRPGKPQLKVTLLPGALNQGIDAQQLSSQLRAAYQGVKVSDVFRGREAYEINVVLDSEPANALQDFKQLTVFSKQGIAMPLSAVARITEEREYARILRIDHQPTVTVSGDVDAQIANTASILNDTEARFLGKLREQYPNLKIGLEGEVANDAETSGSILSGFLLAIIGVYLLLSLQFKNYREPMVVLLNIPLALIGVIWGHWAMGLDLTLPSMIGFVALAGVVVNDSILMVEFVKLRNAQGMSLHEAAAQAVKDRFRAIFLTSVTTVAGMLPLLSETSLQAQILVPLVASIVFGMLSATLLLIFVLPAAYSILEDFGFTELDSYQPQ